VFGFQLRSMKLMPLSQINNIEGSKIEATSPKGSLNAVNFKDYSRVGKLFRNEIVLRKS